MKLVGTWTVTALRHESIIKVVLSGKSCGGVRLRERGKRRHHSPRRARQTTGTPNLLADRAHVIRPVIVYVGPGHPLGNSFGRDKITLFHRKRRVASRSCREIARVTPRPPLLPSPLRPNDRLIGSSGIDSDSRSTSFLDWLSTRHEYKEKYRRWFEK